MIADHLPILQVVVPLLSAPAIILLRSRQIAWGIATLASWLALAISIGIALQVADSGTTT
jgi:multicomponent Na+:H+ antiporter subunit D